MSPSSNIGKMFGALVLGGGVLLSSNGEATPPATKNDSPTTKETAPTQQDSEKSKKTSENEFCQLEFTHIQYSGEGRTLCKTLNTTCLDEKTDEEILKIIKEAQKNTCSSPFCGCWLG